MNGGDFIAPPPDEAAVAAQEKEAARSIARYLSNPEWRMNNLYWITDAFGNKVKFHMNDVQRDFFRRQWWKSVVPKSRQHGLSTLIALMMLDMCLFNRNKTGGIIDRTDLEGQKKLAKIRYAYDHLDDPDDPSTAALGGLLKGSVKVTRANEHEIRWDNDSQAWTATSLRGGTVQLLHVSELGPIAYYDPQRAEEIRTGALNTVHAGSRVIIESTHKGGRYGLFYELVEKARACPRDATPMDWRLFFYGWHMDPKNKMQHKATEARYNPMGAEKDYFDSLRAQGILLSRNQMEWWVKKKRDMGDFMSSEFPSTLEEMLDSVVKGAIYGPQITKLREEGRVTDFNADPGAPLYTFWDLGQKDLVCIWLAQFVGPNIGLLDYFSSCRQQVYRYVEVVKEWEKKYGIRTRYNILPHDGEVKGGFGPSWRQELSRAGLSSIVCVPQTRDRWIGINLVRRLLPMCMIHASNCGRAFENVEGQKIPSGLEALENYRVEMLEEGSGKSAKEMPVHNDFSHGADALRTLAEAMSMGMLRGSSVIEKSFRNSTLDVPSGLVGDEDPDGYFTPKKEMSEAKGGRPWRR